MQGVNRQGIPHDPISSPSPEIKGRQRSNALAKADALIMQMRQQLALASTHIQQTGSSAALGSNSGGLRNIKSQEPPAQKNPLSRPGRPVGYKGRAQISNSEQVLTSVPKQAVVGRQLLSQPLPMPQQAKSVPFEPVPLPEPQQLQVKQVIMPAPQFGAQYTTVQEPQKAVRSNQVRIEPKELAAAKMKTRTETKSAWKTPTTGVSAKSQRLMQAAGSHRSTGTMENKALPKNSVLRGKVSAEPVYPRDETPETEEIATLETFRPESADLPPTDK